MTDKTLTTQQEQSGINIIAGRSGKCGSSAIAASLQALKGRTLRILEEPPEFDFSTLSPSVIVDKHPNPQGERNDPIHGHPHPARCVNG